MSASHKHLRCIIVKSILSIKDKTTYHKIMIFRILYLISGHLHKRYD